MTVDLVTMLPTLAALGPQWMDPQYLLNTYGIWLALIVVFVECGLLWPILPGDSLLFMIGVFAATGLLTMSLPLALVLLIVAAFLGNVSGYWIGRLVGPPIYEKNWKFLKREWFDKTHEFFERYGNRALVLGRFVPIVRTFITLVAGVGKMEQRRFFTWSAVGAVIWVVLVTMAGYFLGNIPFIKKNLEAAILLVVFVSVLPMVFEWWRHRKETAAAAAGMSGASVGMSAGHGSAAAVPQTRASRREAAQAPQSAPSAPSAQSPQAAHRTDDVPFDQTRD